MSKEMQEHNEMQDEELYALLEQALDQERLCVSEELIQKTLKKIEMQGTAEQMPKQAAKKKPVFVRYASAAAAAVLLVALGIGMKDTIGLNHKTAEDAMPEMVADRAGESEQYEYSSHSTAGNTKPGTVRNASSADASTDSEVALFDGLKDQAEPEEQVTVYWDSTEFSFTEEWGKAEADDVVVTNETQEAECWEFVETEDDWMTELTRCLAETEPKNKLSSETGDYKYSLACKDGSVRIIRFYEPLERIVRIQTEQGVLWCLFGETAYLYKDN